MLQDTSTERHLRVLHSWSQGTQTKHGLNTPPGVDPGVNWPFLWKGDIWLPQNSSRAKQHTHMDLLGAKWEVNQANKVSCH